jgi:hypothetical protein
LRKFIENQQKTFPFQENPEKQATEFFRIWILAAGFIELTRRDLGSAFILAMREWGMDPFSRFPRQYFRGMMRCWPKNTRVTALIKKSPAACVPDGARRLTNFAFGNLCNP